jgi:hypothetical protein
MIVLYYITYICVYIIFSTILTYIAHGNRNTLMENLRIFYENRFLSYNIAELKRNQVK